MLNALSPLLQLRLEGWDAADGGELHRDLLHLRKDLVRAACLLLNDHKWQDAM